MKLLAAGTRREDVLVRAAAALLRVVLRFLGWTTRREIRGGSDLLGRWARGEPVIVTFWHGRLVMMPFIYTGRGACIMNSGHRDGRLVSEVIAPWRIRAVHGSSTRGWLGGLRGLLKAHAQGQDLVVVPDGPRGPSGVVKPGVVQLARATGLPIFPLSFAASRSRRLERSWDRMLIPLPGARVVFEVGLPIVVPRDADPATVEAARVRLEQELDAATARAEAAVGGVPGTPPQGVVRNGDDEPLPGSASEPSSAGGAARRAAHAVAPGLHALVAVSGSFRNAHGRWSW